MRAGEEARPLESKLALELHPGDRLRLWTTGSGGHGPPLERDAERVLDDVLDERISRDSARDIYGVVISDDTIDMDATRKRRAELAAVAGQ
jgi:N-methylhydantoinase B